MLGLNFVAASDRGLVRGNNEDSAYAGPHLLVLADGMGGHAAGEVASQLMVEHLEHLDRDPGDADMLALLGAGAEDANAAIAESVAAHPEQNGMGTTLTALMFNGAQFGLIHVGDSRGYLLRDGELRQITKDDTFVQSLVDEGRLAAEDVSTHPQKSLILKAYTGREVEPYLELIEARPGDRVLLCSDGLSDPVTFETIALALGDGTPEFAAQRLVELALRSGGPDNVTVVIAEVVEVPEGAVAESSAPAKVGALAPGYEPTHPDSSASRAAALLRKSETIQPNTRRDTGASAGAAGTAEEPAADDEEAHTPAKADKGAKGVWPWVIGALLLAIVLVFSGLMWMQSRGEDSYALTVDNDGEFVIEHEHRPNPFADAEVEALQHACLTDEGDLRVIAKEDTPGDCHVFGLEDLPKEERNSIEQSLDDGARGTYDAVLGRLNELADEALPVCVDKQTPDKNACREAR
ncbi:PP2C family serine/threonine-protein phosphatase [Corynebacterium sp. Marseille-P4321]|uniref:PP2C family protein-serine/threonine phosphatase n=1 Tax=Corynebacterium sp. Marseille-P4321 TaxID=2736603 RepID=UPI00158E57C7|nr:protein phosphatase 2C domain-containing protein [Corynebacterium sp. Marseille-P4321]